MKKSAYVLVIVLVAFCLLCIECIAGPYFRPINPAHPVVSAGGFYDPVGTDKPDFGSMLALVTHSTKDGAILQSIQADWTPLALGGGYGNGQAFIAIGPSANMAPVAKALGLAILKATTKDDKYTSLKSLLSPDRADSDLLVSFGPAILTKPVQDGAWIPMGRWAFKPRLFAGAAWRF